MFLGFERISFESYTSYKNAHFEFLCLGLVLSSSEYKGGNFTFLGFQHHTDQTQSCQADPRLFSFRCQHPRCVDGLMKRTILG